MKRTRPTERQVAAAKALPDEELIELALRAMHALNRRAKSDRDAWLRPMGRPSGTKARVRMAAIYSLKDVFLETLVAAGRATVGRFVFGVGDHYGDCPSCGCAWEVPAPQTKKGPDRCPECGRFCELAVSDGTEWFLVRAGGVGFHQPGYLVGPTVRAAAVEIPRHDPYQEAGDVPSVPLTIAAQFFVVGIAIERLRSRRTLP